MPFGFHLAMDTLPSSGLRAPRPPVSPGILSTHPPCEGAAGLSPARETPRWAHSPGSSRNALEHERGRGPCRGIDRVARGHFLLRLGIAPCELQLRERLATLPALPDSLPAQGPDPRAPPLLLRP